LRKEGHDSINPPRSDIADILTQRNNHPPEKYTPCELAKYEEKESVEELVRHIALTLGDISDERE